MLDTAFNHAFNTLLLDRFLRYRGLCGVVRKLKPALKPKATPRSLKQHALKNDALHWSFVVDREGCFVVMRNTKDQRCHLQKYNSRRATRSSKNWSSPRS